ncbi:MAG: 2-amino-4-hydroxy-6-hydroxymethyldihydropteridine diphosphokinase [Alistipes sp.]|nr:2-amino-4-hydroxy-6-hydroxymethyldihydropteridine diphosphokinase [Alistipes sp.]
MSGVVDAVLVAGSNLGDREINLQAAVREVDRRCGRVVAVSRVYQSEPWGDVEGPDGEKAGPFLNQAIVVDTPLGPEALLDEIKAIEAMMGRRDSDSDCPPDRQRTYRSRVIDIDIIFYGDLVVDSQRLRIPHRLARQREFVLVPVAEAAPGFRDPETGLTAGELLARMDRGKGQ